MHQKIKELKLTSSPLISTRAYVDEAGDLVEVDLKLQTEDRTVKGYLIVWGVRDTYGTIFIRGCCAKSIQERGPKSQAKNKIIHLWQHRTDEPIGQFTILQEDDYGLYFEAVYDEIPQAERALRQIKSGTLNQYSVGFSYVWDKMVYDETTESVLLNEVELYEGSVVTRASNAETYTIRSENVQQEKEMLDEETEDYIKSVPRSRQLELRQLISRHISLAKLEPIEQRQQSLKDKHKPDEQITEIGGYKLDLKQF